MNAIIISRTQRTPDTITLGFTVDGQALQHRAGQYITVYFADTDVPEGKAYSLSSAPGGEESSITVKNVGLFSGKLHALGVGDSMEISVPYGSFNAFDDTPIVAITAGSGVAPLWSIMLDECQRGTGRDIRLLYSNKTEADIVLKDELRDLVAAHPSVSVQHFITRQPGVPHAIERRIDGARDAAAYAGTHCFYLCGSMQFVRSMWRQLVACGVTPSAISTETFYGVDYGGN